MSASISAGVRENESAAALSAALELAYRLAMVNRALSWHHGTGALSEKHKEPYADSVPGWMQDFLNTEMPARDA